MPVISSAAPDPAAPALGHRPLGRTLAIHSVCVAPAFQRQGHGRTLLRAYLQRMEGAAVADRAALLARPDLVDWYAGLGFEERGPSAATFGGGRWRELVYEFQEPKLWG